MSNGQNNVVGVVKTVMDMNGVVTYLISPVTTDRSTLSNYFEGFETVSGACYRIKTDSQTVSGVCYNTDYLNMIKYLQAEKVGKIIRVIVTATTKVGVPIDFMQLNYEELAMLEAKLTEQQ